MSKWTDLRDDVVEILDVEEVTEQMKQEVMKQRCRLRKDS